MPWTETARREYRRDCPRCASDLTADEWALLSPFMLRPRGIGRSRMTDLREIVNAVRYMRNGSAGRLEGVCDGDGNAGASEGGGLNREVGLSRREAAGFVDAVIEAIGERLAAGEAVRISRFGNFVPRRKGGRMGRNPKTGEPAQIPARRVVAFQPSWILKEGVNQRLPGAREDA